MQHTSFNSSYKVEILFFSLYTFIRGLKKGYYIFSFVARKLAVYIAESEKTHFLLAAPPGILLIQRPFYVKIVMKNEGRLFKERVEFVSVMISAI